MKTEDIEIIERSASAGILIGLLVTIAFIALLIYANTREDKP